MPLLGHVVAQNQAHAVVADLNLGLAAAVVPNQALAVVHALEADQSLDHGADRSHKVARGVVHEVVRDLEEGVDRNLAREADLVHDLVVVRAVAQNQGILLNSDDFVLLNSAFVLSSCLDHAVARFHEAVREVARNQAHAVVREVARAVAPRADREADQEVALHLDPASAKLVNESWEVEAKTSPTVKAPLREIKSLALPALLEIRATTSAMKKIKRN